MREWNKQAKKNDEKWFMKSFVPISSLSFLLCPFYRSLWTLNKYGIRRRGSLANDNDDNFIRKSILAIGRKHLFLLSPFSCLSLSFLFKHTQYCTRQREREKKNKILRLWYTMILSKTREILLLFCVNSAIHF